MTRLTEVKLTRDPKYNELSMNINKPRPTKIIWEWPDTVEMTDKDGKVHVYSIIELLDGLQRLARAEQKDVKDERDNKHNHKMAQK